MIRIPGKGHLLGGLLAAGELVSEAPEHAQATSANVPVVTLADARARARDG